MRMGLYAQTLTKLFRMVLHSSGGASVQEDSFLLLNSVTLFEVCRITMRLIECCPEGVGCERLSCKALFSRKFLCVR